MRLLRSSAWRPRSTARDRSSRGYTRPHLREPYFRQWNRIGEWLDMLRDFDAGRGGERRSRRESDGSRWMSPTATTLKSAPPHLSALRPRSAPPTRQYPGRRSLAAPVLPHIDPSHIPRREGRHRGERPSRPTNLLWQPITSTAHNPKPRRCQWSRMNRIESALSSYVCTDGKNSRTRRSAFSAA